MTSDIRGRILDAAVQLLENEGVKAFGQVRVARAAGVKQGNITYHFPKKSDLVAGVIERVNQRRGAELADLVAQAGTLAPAALRALLFDRLPAMAVDVKRSRVMLALLIEAHEDPAVGRMLAEVTLYQRTTIAALLRRAPDDPDLEIVFAMLSGLSLHGLGLGREPDHVAALVARFRHWLPILLPDAPTRRAPTARATTHRARPPSRGAASAGPRRSPPASRRRSGTGRVRRTAKPARRSR